MDQLLCDGGDLDSMDRSLLDYNNGGPGSKKQQVTSPLAMSPPPPPPTAVATQLPPPPPAATAPENSCVNAPPVDCQLSSPVPPLLSPQPSLSPQLLHNNHVIASPASPVASSHASLASSQPAAMPATEAAAVNGINGQQHAAPSDTGSQPASRPGSQAAQAALIKKDMVVRFQENSQSSVSQISGPVALMSVNNVNYNCQGVSAFSQQQQQQMQQQHSHSVFTARRASDSLQESSIEGIVFAVINQY